MSSKRNSVGGRPKDATRIKIEKMEEEREERRKAMQERKLERVQEATRQKAAGITGDVDFNTIIAKWREEHAMEANPHSADGEARIVICVRKRPISEKEVTRKDHDCVTCLHPVVWVHASKLRVDGISKYLDHSSFSLDHAFDELVTTQEVYEYSTLPLLEFTLLGTGGRATVFAYGQTGSGKTYTMQGIQNMVVEELFNLLQEGTRGCSLDNTKVTVAFFEIYGGFIQDLLNDRNRLKILEDGQGEIVVTGLQEHEAQDAPHLLEMVTTGNLIRTTHATEANDTSSRSHAICQIFLRNKVTGKLSGKMSLVDLAGSERGTDTKQHNSQRRNESAEINTSLLALKECIRALDKPGNNHVPYRASKLTLVLKDCFTSSQARTTMIATMSPGASSADHTLNTLRYADRIKEKRVGVSDDKSSAMHSKQLTRPLPRPPDAPARVPVSRNEDEAELRRTVQALFEQEEQLLNTHMNNIQINAELLTEEGKMLQSVQRNDVSEEEIEDYAARLTEILDHKAHLIEDLADKMDAFRANLRKEEMLSKKVGNLSQY